MVEESVDERTDEPAEEAEYPRLSRRARIVYILLALLPAIAFMGEIGYHTFRPIRTNYNPRFLDEQSYGYQLDIAELRRAVGPREMPRFQNLENLSATHRLRIDALNALLTEITIALEVVHSVDPIERRDFRHESAMQLVTWLEGLVYLQRELLQAGHEELETIESDQLWTEGAESCRERLRDWDGEAYCLRKLGPKGHAMVAGRAAQRRCRALRRSFLSIGPDFRLPFILPGD